MHNKLGPVSCELLRSYKTEGPGPGEACQAQASEKSLPAMAGSGLTGRCACHGRGVGCGRRRCTPANGSSQASRTWRCTEAGIPDSNPWAMTTEGADQLAGPGAQPVVAGHRDHAGDRVLLRPATGAVKESFPGRACAGRAGPPCGFGSDVRRSRGELAHAVREHWQRPVLRFQLVRPGPDAWHGPGPARSCRCGCWLDARRRYRSPGARARHGP